MRLAIIGTGYVGLVTGTCLASLEHRVTCIDVDENKINSLQQGDVPFYEPGLPELIQEQMSAGRLDFSTGNESVTEADAVFLAVGTPDKEDGSANLSYLKAAAESIAPLLKEGALIVTKSTVPPGTNQMLANTYGCNVASNPEFLREGSAVKDFMEADRIVVGVANDEAEKLLRNIYAPQIEQGVPFIATDIISAEMIKYASNSFLALKLGFVNELANICEAVGADIQSVVQGMGSDKRIGINHLQPGPGFGGSCFPKDIRALDVVAREHDIASPILGTLIETNEQRVELMVQKIADAVGELKGAKIGALGLAFKANTDDTRYSPALQIIEKLQGQGAEVAAYDPQATVSGLKQVNNPYDAARGADALVILTEWPEFAELDLEQLNDALGKLVIVDLRNMLDPQAAKASGFTYSSIGR